MKKIIYTLIFLIVNIINALLSRLVWAENEAGELEWRQSAGKIDWQERYDHAAVEFKGKMCIFGGLGYAKNYLSDFYCSSDGEKWEKVGENLNTGGITGYAAVVFKNKIWILGGLKEKGAYLNEIWYSEDGITWKKADQPAARPERTYHTAVVFQDKIWILGGLGVHGQYFDDIWYSEDGVNWQKAEEKARWQGRFDHASIVFGNKIWVVGGVGERGTYFNGVWYSSDGINWNKVDSKILWPERYGHALLEYKGKLWIIGGLGVDLSYLNDVWSSQDGFIWEKIGIENKWKGRTFHGALTFEDKMWILGGLSGAMAYLNEVWSAELATINKNINSPENIIIADEPAAADSEKPEKFKEDLVFKDVDNSAEIEYLKANNIIDGYPDRTFKPPNLINRAEFLKIAIGAVGITPGGNNCFSDVKEEWFAPYVCKAKEKEIVHGYSDGSFQPSKKINVAEALKIIFKAFSIKLSQNSANVSWYRPFEEYARENNYYLDSFSSVGYQLNRKDMAELIYKIIFDFKTD